MDSEDLAAFDFLVGAIAVDFWFLANLEGSSVGVGGGDRPSVC